MLEQCLYVCSFIIFSKHAVICSLGASNSWSGLYVVNNFTTLEAMNIVICISHGSYPITLSFPFFTWIFLSSTCHSTQVCKASVFKSSNTVCRRIPCPTGYSACREATWSLRVSVGVQFCHHWLGICKAVAFTYMHFWLLCIWAHAKKLFGGCVNLC